MANKILVIDDDVDILELLSYNLRKEGYEVQTAVNGMDGLETTKSFMPDLILIDIMMPIIDGIQAGKIIKSTDNLKHIHLIYLTARSEEFTEVAAFELGADDFLAKPIKPRALLSRINAYFKKEKSLESEDFLEILDLKIDKRNYTVTKGDSSVVILPKKEFELLFYLASHPNKVQSREALLENIWGIDVFVVDRTIDVHIRKVREKIGEDYIGTIKGVGYMFRS